MLHVCTLLHHNSYKYTTVTVCAVTQLVEKMSCQPAPKTSRQVKTQPNKQEELYEHIEMQQEPSHYMTINRSNRVEVEDKSQPEPASQISTKTKIKCVVIALIAVFLVIALIVTLVAVIIYSPLVSGDTGNLLSRIQQLERTNTVQIASMQNLIQASTSVQNNLRQDLDRLRTINLYEGCIQETKTCTILSASITTYATCNTIGVTINPGVSISP